MLSVVRAGSSLPPEVEEARRQLEQQTAAQEEERRAFEERTRKQIAEELEQTYRSRIEDEVPRTRDGLPASAEEGRKSVRKSA